MRVLFYYYLIEADIKTPIRGLLFFFFTRLPAFWPTPMCDTTTLFRIHAPWRFVETPVNKILFFIIPHIGVLQNAYVRYYKIIFQTGALQNAGLSIPKKK